MLTDILSFLFRFNNNLDEAMNEKYDDHYMNKNK